MRIFIIFVISVFILTGCVQKRIIDEINIIAGEAYDMSEGDTFIASILIQEYLPDKSIENKVFTTKGKIRGDLLLNAQKQSAGDIATGGIEVTIFGDKIANFGIIDFVDSYERDASIGSRSYLATAHRSALEILKGNYGPQGVSKYLSNMIKHNIEERDVPITNLHLFLRDFYMQGKDPYLPEIKQKSPKEVEISGMSLFKGDKEAYVLPKEKMFFFKLLTDRHSQGNFRVHLGKGEDAAVRSIKSKNKYKIEKKDHSHVNISININGDIREYTGKKLNQQKVDKIAKKLEKDVEKECLKLVKLFQEKEVDPIGFGHLHLKKVRGYDFSKWKEDYQKLTFTVKAQVDITETGVVE